MAGQLGAHRDTGYLHTPSSHRDYTGGEDVSETTRDKTNFREY